MYFSPAQPVCYANDNDVYVPELWANEALNVLVENMVIARLVNTDFRDKVASAGDVVNIGRPHKRVLRRRTDASPLVDTDVSNDTIRVPLDQNFYDSWIIKDGEASKAGVDLIRTHVTPSMQAIARGVDRAILGRIHAFLSQGDPSKRAGKLQGLTTANASDFIREARGILNEDEAPTDDHKLVLSANSETTVLGVSEFLKANERGDGGSALTNGLLGRILGFDTFMAQNVKHVREASADIAAGTVTNAAVAGVTASQVVSVSNYEAIVGEYAVMLDNGQPTIIDAVTADTHTTAVTLNEPLKYAVGAVSRIVVYKHALVEGTKTAGYSEEILLDTYTSGKHPQVGQIVSFDTGASRHTYTILEVKVVSATSSTVLLDRPLESTITDEDAAFLGPAGSMNWAFHRDAITLVTRPLVLPSERSGVMSAVAQSNGVGLRIVMQYDRRGGGMGVSMDILAGVAVMDTNLAVPLLG
jgi:hypothetical protein